MVYDVFGQKEAYLSQMEEDEVLCPIFSEALGNVQSDIGRIAPSEKMKEYVWALQEMARNDTSKAYQVVGELDQNLIRQGYLSFGGYRYQIS